MFVIDASVVYKWLVDEGDEETKLAVKLRQDHLANRDHFIAPDILLYEIANTFAYKSKNTEVAISKAWNSFLLLNLPVISPTPRFMGECLKFSQKYKISVYDAAYVVLASLNKCILITADKKLVNRVNSPFVRLLSAE